jgi:hypothetical protein
VTHHEPLRRLPRCRAPGVEGDVERVAAALITEVQAKGDQADNAHQDAVLDEERARGMAHERDWFAAVLCTGVS